MADASVTENIRAGLSRNESILLSSLSEKDKTIFKLEDVMAELKCPYTYAKVLAYNLARKKWIIVLRRGVYLIVPLSAGIKSQYTEHEFVIASYLVSPYYIAYWSALNFHGFTEQTPFSVFVATTRRIQNIEVLNVKYNFVTLNKRKFFGFEPTAVGTYKVNVSNREKTLAASNERVTERDADRTAENQRLYASEVFAASRSTFSTFCLAADANKASLNIGSASNGVATDNF